MSYAADAYGAAPYAGEGDAGSAGTLTLAGSLPSLTGSFTVDPVLSVTLAGSLPSLTGAFDFDVVGAANEITLAASLPGLTGSFDLAAAGAAGDFTFAGSLPGLTAEFDLGAESIGDTSNRVAGRVRSGYGDFQWAPAVVAPPLPMVVHNYDTAVAFSAPEFRADGSVKPLTVVKAHKARYRQQLIVGGKDVTFFRGSPSPFSYRLIEPLLYGAGSIDFPQIAGALEHIGVGKLAWLAKGKPVTIRSIDTETGEVVSNDDYRGFVSDINIDGSGLRVDLGGEVSGRASLTIKHVPTFRGHGDAGRRWYDVIKDHATSPVLPRLGPNTGIRIINFGGMSALDFLNELGAKTVNEDGEQWTTERVDGVWRYRKKNLTTKHFTVYADDARMVLSVASAISEEPNRIFADGVTEEGRRWAFTDYPGLIEGDAAPYPFNNTSTTFGLGTTDADTDTGDGVAVMIHRLIITGLLDRRDSDGFFDSDVRRAVRQLQDRAGIAVTGVVNLATWRKLYDLDATGFTTNGAVRRPAAQLSRVRPWNLTSSGAIAERNPSFDRSVVPVEHAISVGPGFTPSQGRDFARTKLVPSPNWVGTLTMHLAPIRGEHNYGDPLTSADLMPGRSVRPGMNVWVPNFQGGTLFHVSGVEVPADGPVVLTVDTRARDTMEAWQVIQRNRESRVNPARAWVRQNRSSQMTKDALQGWDIKAGITSDRQLRAGWNVIEVIGGDEGTVQRIKARLSPAREFAIWVTGRKITPKWCKARVEFPLSKAGTARFNSPAVRNSMEDKILLYSAGGFEAECGYWPHPRQDEETGETIAAPLTGKWQDDAGFSYRTFSDPVLYVAIWVPSATVLPKQTLMIEQLETGS